LTTYKYFNVDISSGTMAGTLTNNYGFYCPALPSGTYRKAICVVSDTSFFGGNVGIGNETPKAKLDLNGTLCYTPQNTGDITAGTGITAAMLWADMRYNGSSAIDITSVPQIVDGVDGQIIKIIGLSDVNTLTLDDGNGLQLAGGSSMVLGSGDVIMLTYILSLDLWIEQSRSDN
jgi:hypothetical protein